MWFCIREKLNRLNQESFNWKRSHQTTAAVIVTLNFFINCNVMSSK